MADGESTPFEGDEDPFERLVTAIERDLEEQRKPHPRWQQLLTPVTVALSAIGLGWTIWSSEQQSRGAAEQFDQTLRQNQYADIVNGLASPSVGVQVNSIRRLRQYVADPANYAGDAQQQEAAQNAAQTLAAFIEDESRIPGHEGLSDYRDPYPVVVSRAMRQLVELTTPPPESELDATHFPDVALDLSRGNFHGVPAAGFEPEGPFLAVAADFRGATVTDWDLTAVDEPTLASAFFTCANLQTSDLGTADVAGADFTGANLRGADLTWVRNLTSEQLSGALVGEETKLPPGVEAPPQPGWGIVQDGDTFRPSPRCRHLMDQMTHLLAGSGYSSRIPCPSDTQTRWTIRLSDAEQSALEQVCRLRAAGGQGAG